MPDQPISQQTIDITDLVEQARSAFVDWAVAFVMGEEVIAIPELGPIVAFPLVADVEKILLRDIFDFISKGIVMQGFFINTAMRKAAQAQDFADASNALANIPPGATNDQILALEKARMAAFANFVAVTN